MKARLQLSCTNEWKFLWVIVVKEFLYQVHFQLISSRSSCIGYIKPIRPFIGPMKSKQYLRINNPRTSMLFCNIHVCRQSEPLIRAVLDVPDWLLISQQRFNISADWILLCSTLLLLNEYTRSCKLYLCNQIPIIPMTGQLGGKVLAKRSWDRRSKSKSKI